jgi:purine-nucleoside phosphorylase
MSQSVVKVTFLALVIGRSRPRASMPGMGRSNPSEDPFISAAGDAKVLAERTGVAHHDVAVVLGSGLGGLADELGQTVAVPVAELPGFPVPVAEGHAGTFSSVSVGLRKVLLLGGRCHLYDGYTPNEITHAVRTAAAAGCTVVVLTNAAGSINAKLPVGLPTLITDHLNLTGMSPLTGVWAAQHGSRFPDMSDVYSTRLRALAKNIDPEVGEGVYAGLLGPSYETPAEIKYLRAIGADLVGMSTVHEAIAAKHLGLEVLCISLPTNLAAGIGDTELNHEEVLEAGRAAGPRMKALVKGVLEQL